MSAYIALAIPGYLISLSNPNKYSSCGRFYLHTAFKMYMYNCEWQEQFRNMTEMKPKQVKLVGKNTEH